ncbi:MULTISPECIES: hypothetical protein [Tsukamurella]|uniref:PspA domain-containing protein n=2 Tax=Tsukamurella TaxID=2060 RepID=A0A5C5S1R3_9ACTN|nr:MULTISPECIES: hypothetical protein [Tsukamurella]NMD54260.1 hypothetical protein [Tsukamurella columbiensis]TWS28221.1 hypothetical protein FK530_14170 [Tsukamurella conjunctivitidis]
MTHPADDAQNPSPEPTPAASEPIDAEIVDIVPTGPVAPSYEDVTGYTAAGVPTFDHIRDKIERRTTTALGAEELAHGTTAGQDAERAFAEREKAAKAKLEEIRRSMGS